MNALKVFEAAARHLSFKKAAEELHVTPGAVSHQLSQLEAQLGIKLFDRASQGIRLTPSARACLPRSQHGLDTLRDSVDLLGSGARTIINVASPPSFAQRWLIPRLHRFVLDQPDIDVHVTTRLVPFLSDWQSRLGTDVRTWGAEADVVIVFSEARQDEVRAELLLPLTVEPLCTPEFHARHGFFRDPSAVGGLHRLHDDRGVLYGSRSFWRIWLESVGVLDLDPEPGAHFAHAILALGAAEEGVGIVASTPALAADALSSGRLIRPFATECPLPAGYRVFSPGQAAKRADVALFRSWLCREARSQSNRPASA